jgi:APA family basic amino acid/polyamine antiporter
MNAVSTEWAEAQNASAPPQSLAPVLGSASLTGLGIGGMIGSGIFVMAGVAARDVAGPAVLVSFLIAAAACGCAALCFAELAGRIPEAGSAYAYARTLLGRRLGWLVAWNLILQYGVAAASVAQGWSHYFQDALAAVGLSSSIVPSLLRGAAGTPPGAVADLPAVAAVAAITFVLLRGIAPSVRVNNAVVFIKLAIILLVIVVGFAHFRPENWAPFAPFGWGGLHLPGAGAGPPRGVLAGAAIVFYAYLGFEALTVYSEESHTPRRDVPRSILRSVIVCTVVYIAMAAALTGMVRYDHISLGAPVSDAFGQAGLPWARTVVSLGALAGITSVLLVILLSLPRLLMAISRDGLLPEKLAGGIHPRWKTPWRATLNSGLAVSLLAAIVPLQALGAAAVLSNLVTFIVVSLLVLVARSRPGGTDDAFRAPGGAAIPVASIFACLVLMLSLPSFAWLAIGSWLVVGAGIYTLRGRRGAER